MWLILNMNTKLRMYKVLLLKFRRYLYKGSTANGKEFLLRSKVKYNKFEIAALHALLLLRISYIWHPLFISLFNFEAFTCLIKEVNIEY